MGTNIYAIHKNPEELVDYEELLKLTKEHNWQKINEWHNCTEEKITKNIIHIGKRSGGWKFIFNHNNWKYYNHTKESITNFLKECYKLENEYGDPLTIEDFWKGVESNKDGIDGKSYCDLELKRSEQVASGELEDPYGRYMTIHQARAYAHNSALHNYYEEKYDKDSNLLPKEMDYRFSSSTEFC